MRTGYDTCSAKRTLAALAFGAVILRLLLFLGRGDYIAFDEGWYLLLGRSIWSGEGYRLTGLRHYTLSPLFPILAGGVTRIIGDPVWAGRIVAAVTAGLLVLPCWSIFRRLAGRQTALLGCLLVAVLPSLAPFVAPELVGWDLWVGSEPVFHLFLYSGIALVLRAWERRRVLEWCGAGVAFSLAYLARPEAVVVAGLVGVITVAAALVRRSPRALVGPVVLGAAFAVVAVPYWRYLHEVTGRWSLTGRAVQLKRPATVGGGKAAATIEGMLWQGRHGAYVRNLFGLNASGTRLISSYWGVADVSEEVESMPGPDLAPSVERQSLPELTPAAQSEAEIGAEGEAYAGSRPGARAADGGADTMAAASKGAAPSTPPPSRFILYLKAIGKIIPVWLAPFAIVGLVALRRRFQRAELLVTLPLLAASGLIARFVAIDPRTQLILVPLSAYYAARGIRVLGVLFDRDMPAGMLQRGFVGGVLAFAVAGWLTMEDVRRLYLGASGETEHQVRSALNREVGEALRGAVPEGKCIMSWHPAIGLHARREWRVLPLATFPQVMRYAHAVGCDYVVLSVLYPSPIPVDQMPRNHLVVKVPVDMPEAESWRVELSEVHEQYAIGHAVMQ